MNAKSLATSYLMSVLILGQAVAAGAGEKKTQVKSKDNQNVNVQVESPEYTVASKGVRVEFIKSFLDGKLKLSDGMLSNSISGEVEQDFGLGIGYANIRVDAPGFLARLIYNQFNNNKANSLRLEGNGTYGLTENVYLFGGINLQKFTKGPDQLDTGLGFQFGAGLQLNQNFGLSLSYVMLNNSGNDDDLNVDLQAKGFELGLHGTF